MRDLSNVARISVSSFKEEHPPEKVMDGSTDTYWQSDGPQPHYVNLEFPQLMTLTKLSIYVDHSRDESYTPSIVAIRAGNSHYDLQDLHRYEIGEASGWIDFSLSEDEETLRPLRAHIVQLCILGNLQNGKDTHIRQLKIYGPNLRQDMLPDNIPPFSTLEYQM
ncbi:hypothetical protein SpCBS45565_g00184 [Spizellomyces sp. 'palustris']|nr:hypothetical protein SpCBS45565_g00184 [Spizellomyces sp. 'palustris']